MSKTFIKTLVLTILTYVAVIGTALSTASCVRKSGQKPVSDTTIVQQPVAQWSSAKDFLDWTSEEVDEQYCDSIIFKVMSPEELYNVATVVATRNDFFTKKDIVREYREHRDVYTALHGNDAISTNTKDTIIDGVRVKLISTTRYE